MILRVKGEWGRQGEGEAKTVSRDDILCGPVPSRPGMQLPFWLLVLKWEYNPNHE